MLRRRGTPGKDAAILARFTDLSVMIVGDVILDIWIEGTVNRISREAPVFIVDQDNITYTPGGAAHTAVQLAALGASVTVLGWCGRDAEGDKLRHLLARAGVSTGGLIAIPAAETVTKTRVSAGSPYSVRQQVIRIDRGRRPPDLERVYSAWLPRLNHNHEEPDMVIISDYGYGAGAKDWLQQVVRISKAKGAAVFCDSRYHLDHCAGATAVTPNEPEFAALIGRAVPSDDELLELMEATRTTYGWQALLVTRGGQGMALATPNDRTFIPPWGPPEPVDVTGAGDTVLAMFALATVASCGDYRSAAQLAAVAAGIAVQHQRTYAVTRDEVRQALATV